MFERKYKHLHARVNPLDGNRDEIIGRLGVLLDQLSDYDLASIGLQRITVVEAGRDEAHLTEGGQSRTDRHELTQTTFKFHFIPSARPVLAMISPRASRISASKSILVRG